MQLGRALIGAIIGAAIGIGVLLAVYLLFKIDSVWLALAVAVLTGLGVRTMVATGGHASYLRGALTGAIALGAYLLGSYVVAAVMQANVSKASQATRIEQPAAKAEADVDADDDKGEVETEAPPKAAPAASRPATGTARQPMPAKGFSTLDFVLLCVSALVAYELGRGTAGPKPVVVEGEAPATTDEMPQGTHPDA
jgi:hypothetical protein